MSAFIFCNQDKVEAIHRAELPRGIQNKGALLNAVSDALCFPDYFGGNWDALEECIRDLSWLPEGRRSFASRRLAAFHGSIRGFHLFVDS